MFCHMCRQPEKQLLETQKSIEHWQPTAALGRSKVEQLKRVDTTLCDDSD